jgi:regulator of replication initiation timing
MTENLLQKLEENMIIMLTEVEQLRKDVFRLNQENAALKIERQLQDTAKQNHEKKLQDLVALLDSVKVVEKPITNMGIMAAEVVSIHG